jgi:hypothetical protein
MGATESEHEQFGVLVTAGGMLLGAYFAWLLIFPDQISAYAVLLSAVAALGTLIGFATLFLSRQGAIVASRPFDAEIVYLASDWASRDAGPSADAMVRARAALCYSSYFRDLAGARSAPTALMLGAAALFGGATLASLSWGAGGWGAGMIWTILFGLGAILAFLALGFGRLDIRHFELRPSAEPFRRWISPAVPARWDITEWAIASQPRLLELATRLAEPSARLPRTAAELAAM